VFKGRGIAFSEVRHYIPGDDIRLIDWNVTARMNDVFVKLFSEEREMTVLLVVDMSASGRFGSRQREKRDLAAEIAAVLAFSAIRNNDRVGLIIFTDEVERFVPPKKGKRHVLRVVSEILSFSEKSKSYGARRRARLPGPRRAPARGRVPDLGLSRAGRELRARAAHRIAPPRSGAGVGQRPDGGGDPQRRLHRACRPETGGTVLFDTSGPEAAAFNRAAREAVAARKALFKRLGMDSIDVSTDRPYLKALTAFFEARSMRLRH
jgi:uncharacterized protein (DUF58 family)